MKKLEEKLGDVPEAELQTAEVGADDWMLVNPDTAECVLIMQDGEPSPLMFRSEALASQFKSLYDIPAEFLPTKASSLVRH